MNAKEIKICEVVKAFLKNPSFTIEQLSEITGISKSSVQRYLNDPKKIAELFNKETYDQIQNLIKQNTLEGRRKGGLNFFKNNVALKDDSGRFIGSRKDENNNKIERKCRHILIFSYIFLEHPEMTLEDISNFYILGKCFTKNKK